MTLSQQLKHAFVFLFAFMSAFMLFCIVFMYYRFPIMNPANNGMVNNNNNNEVVNNIMIQFTTPTPTDYIQNVIESIAPKRKLPALIKQNTDLEYYYYLNTSNLKSPFSNLLPFVNYMMNQKEIIPYLISAYSYNENKIEDVIQKLTIRAVPMCSCPACYACSHIVSQSNDGRVCLNQSYADNDKRNYKLKGYKKHYINLGEQLLNEVNHLDGFLFNGIVLVHEILHQILDISHKDTRVPWPYNTSHQDAGVVFENLLFGAHIGYSFIHHRMTYNTYFVHKAYITNILFEYAAKNKLSKKDLKVFGNEPIDQQYMKTIHCEPPMTTSQPTTPITEYYGTFATSCTLRVTANNVLIYLDC